MHSPWCNKLYSYVGNKTCSKLRSKIGSWEQNWRQNSILAFLKSTNGTVLAFLKCTDGSVWVFLKCMDGSVLAHQRFHMQSALTRFPQSGNSEVPELLCKKSTKMSYLKYNDLDTSSMWRQKQFALVTALAGNNNGLYSNTLPVGI